MKILVIINTIICLFCLISEVNTFLNDKDKYDKLIAFLCVMTMISFISCFIVMFRMLN